MATTTTSKAAKTNKSAKASKTVNKPWQLHGSTAERFELVDINPGDKVKFTMGKKEVVGTFKYAKASIRHTEGKAYIEKGGKMYKRVLAHVTAIPQKAVSA